MKKSIVKNTISLYIRMLVIMGVTLYTSRIVLKALGFYDFGLYNVIGSIIIILTFIQGVSSLATQRFISFALGKNDLNEARKYFNASVQAHFIISCIVILLAEMFGRWLVYDKLNFPLDRVDDMMIVYHVSMVTIFFQIMQTPFMSAMIACEKMGAFAKIGIVDAVLRLVLTVIFSVVIYHQKLVMYSIFICSGYLTVFFIYWGYSKYKLSVYYLDFNLKKDFVYIKNVFVFSCWSLFGSLSLVSVSQGFSLLTYYYFGPIANGAVALTEQVLMALSRVSGTIQTAFNPQIVQRYSANDKKEVCSMIEISHSAVFFVIAITAIPLFAEAHYVLSLWLKSYPPLLPDLVKIIALYIIIDSLSGPYVSVAYAIGELKKYQLMISFIMLGSLGVAALMYLNGYSVIQTAFFRIGCSVCVLLYRVYYVKDKLGRTILVDFFKKAPKYAVVSFIGIALSCSIERYIDEGFLRLFTVVVANFVVISILTFIIILRSDDKRKLFGYLKLKY